MHIVLVLWGEGFDEMAAAIFVVGLRRLGKRVQLVGLNRQQIAGQHGLTLVPDLPLGQALVVANSVDCLIIPAPLAALQQFSYDPRLAELLGLVSHNQALAVAGASHSHSAVAYRPASLLASLASKLDPLIYPDAGELLPFICTTLAPRLNGEAAPFTNEKAQLNGNAPHLNGKH